MIVYRYWYSRYDTITHTKLIADPGSRHLPPDYLLYLGVVQFIKPGCRVLYRW